MESKKDSPVRFQLPLPQSIGESYIQVKQNVDQDACLIKPREVRQGQKGTSSKLRTWVMVSFPISKPSLPWTTALGFSLRIPLPISVHRAGMSFTHSLAKFQEPSQTDSSLQLQDWFGDRSGKPGEVKFGFFYSEIFQVIYQEKRNLVLLRL